MSENKANYTTSIRSSHSHANEIKLENNSVNKIHAKILHDIRNMKTLSKEQIADIYKMSSTEQMQIILTYDAMMETWVEYMQSL